MRAARVRKTWVTWDDWWSARSVSGSANLVRVAALRAASLAASSALSALRSLVAGDPLYGDAPACGMEHIDLLDDLLDNILPRRPPGILAGLNGGLVVSEDHRAGVHVGEGVLVS
jgi:hypothetical protein